MPLYYVTHPNIDISATVHGAPSTEKARTMFLDWLERRGRIRRSRRGYYREDMVAERMSGEGEITSDVDLYYGGEDRQPVVRYTLGEPTRREVPAADMRGEAEEELEREPSPEEDEVQPVELYDAETRQVRRRSPIAEASLGSLGR